MFWAKKKIRGFSLRNRNSRSFVWQSNIFTQRTLALLLFAFGTNSVAASLFVCSFGMCARANVLRVADSSISQNNQWVGYRVCMCSEAASRDTLTPGGSKTDISRADETKGEAVLETIKDGKSSVYYKHVYGRLRCSSI